uniref:Root specific protein n=1 Tax=Triticum aestivum TaxID=4565 RepID=E6Y2I3_WHEAT|nr:root specific protein [Triticum aestivum]
MAGKASIALFPAVNLVVFSVASACGGNCPTPSTPTPTPAAFGRCPRDAVKIGLCVNALNLVKAELGAPPTLPCCPLVKGLVDLEAALCLCTVLKANVLNIVKLNLPIDLSVIPNDCGKKVPTGFQC